MSPPEPPSSEAPGRTRTPQALGSEAVAQRIEATGHGAWLVGRALVDAFVDPPLGRTGPREAPTFWTTAEPSAIAGAFPRACPVHRGGRLWRIAGAAMPIHVQSVSPAVEAALERMPFGALAAAMRPETGALSGPGWPDLAAGLLTLYGEPGVCARRDPLVVLRAACLTAETGLTPADDLGETLRSAASGLGRADPAHAATLLRRALMGPEVGRAAALLEAAQARTVGLGLPDATAPAIDVASLPRDWPLRLVAWARGAKPGQLLGRLRLGRGARERFGLLCEHHPIEQRLTSTRPRAIRRLLDRLGRSDVDGLVALRRATGGASTEVDVHRLDEIERACDAVADDTGPARALAVGGRDLMDALGLTPGPSLGGLLTALEEAVDAGRVANARDDLLAFARGLERD